MAIYGNIENVDAVLLATVTAEVIHGGDQDEGSLLPAVTATDNGKFLRVVSGAWAAVEISSANGVSF